MLGIAVPKIIETWKVRINCECFLPLYSGNAVINRIRQKN
jgi:hypothetical protein